MNKIEYLLVCLMEEAAEIQQMAAKALRFGLENHHPCNIDSNAVELQRELIDLDSIHFMLVQEKALPSEHTEPEAMHNKINKVNRYMKISRECGTLEQEDAQ